MPPSPLRAAIRFALIVAVVAALPGPAAAKLAPSRFSALLAESELICLARVTEAGVDRHRRHAVVEVTKVLKGERPTGAIRFDFRSEEHEQLMTVVGEERLLFLKKVDGKWTGTHYGRSYWPFVPAADPAVGPVTRVVYPIRMVRFEGRYARLLRPTRLPAGAGKVDAGEKMIPLSAVEKVVADGARKPGR